MKYIFRDMIGYRITNCSALTPWAFCLNRRSINMKYLQRHTIQTAERNFIKVYLAEFKTLIKRVCFFSMLKREEEEEEEKTIGY